MRKLLAILLLLQFLPLVAQEHVLRYSTALELYLKPYNAQTDRLLEQGEFDMAKDRFDTLVKNHLQYSYMDTFSFERLNGDFTSTSQFSKPTILMTYASWCIPREGEIPAINKWADRYGDLIDIVVLFWDTKEDAKAASKGFSKDVHVVYVDETINGHMNTVKQLKHSLGISLSFVMAADGKILDINRRPPNKLDKSFLEGMENSVAFISSQVASIYLDLNLNPEELTESLATF